MSDKKNDKEGVLNYQKFSFKRILKKSRFVEAQSPGSGFWPIPDPHHCVNEIEGRVLACMRYFYFQRVTSYFSKETRSNYTPNDKIF